MSWTQLLGARIYYFSGTLFVPLPRLVLQYSQLLWGSRQSSAGNTTGQMIGYATTLNDKREDATYG